MGTDIASIETWRARLYTSLSPPAMGSRTQMVTHGLLIAAIVAGVAGGILGTLPNPTRFEAQLLRYAISGALGIFTIEYLCRFWAAPERDPASQQSPWRARWQYQCSFLGGVDLLVILPQFLGLVFPINQDISNLAMLLALLKSARYAKSLPLLAAVFHNEGRALASGLMVMMVLMVLVSGVMFTLERDLQPQAFRSIPDAMWWAIVTMTTVGYGDVIPMTPLGKMFGGLTMLLGMAMFAIPAGILANGFAAEIRKRDFVVTWHTVASVPLFTSLDATRIASIAQLLKTLILPARQVVVRHGEPADAMYFIMSGEVAVEVLPHPVRLGKGEYFGEIALIKDTLRTATVTTLTECKLLSLDVQDFRRLMAQSPDLKAAIERVADERLHRQPAGTMPVPPE